MNLGELRLGETFLQKINLVTLLPHGEAPCRGKMNL